MENDDLLLFELTSSLLTKQDVLCNEVDVNAHPTKSERSHSAMWMKIVAALPLFVVSTGAFAPLAPSSVRLSTAQHALADRVFGLDLFSPKSDQNDYGARGKKNLKLGKITDSSYVPSGLTKAQYEKIRAAEQEKKSKNYQRNVSKAFKFQDFTKWYEQRGTDLDKGKNDWVGSATLGHSMAKTKFDWSGTEQAKKFESTNTDKFMAAFNKKSPVKKAASKKAAPKKRFIY